MTISDGFWFMAGKALFDMAVFFGLLAAFFVYLLWIARK